MTCSTSGKSMAKVFGASWLKKSSKLKGFCSCGLGSLPKLMSNSELGAFEEVLIPFWFSLVDLAGGSSESELPGMYSATFPKPWSKPASKLIFFSSCSFSRFSRRFLRYSSFFFFASNAFFSLSPSSDFSSSGEFTINASSKPAPSLLVAFVTTSIFSPNFFV